MAALSSSGLLPGRISAGKTHRKCLLKDLPAGAGRGGSRVSVGRRRPVQSSMQLDLGNSSEVAVKAVAPPPRLPLAVEVVLGLDVVAEAELREKGFMGPRKTKLVCTVGPASYSPGQLERRRG